jgi:Cd2+/Zn2+-exporting ATPase
VRSATCATGSGSVGDCAACDDLLALANAIERRSEHPLAQAITSASSTRGLDQRYAATNVTALVGRGVQGSVDGHEILIGSHTYFDGAIPHAPEDCAQATQDAQAGYTPVFVSADGTYRGTLTVADQIRSTSHTAIAQLKQLGLRVVMLTGDAQATASRIASEIGVTDIRAELLPEQKVAAIRDLQRQYGAVAMVGDGINDTPALAAASVGIAISTTHGGTSQAMETADITLLSDDLRRLPLAIKLSRAAISTVRFNIAFSIAIKIAFLVLVVLGMGTMWMAVLADVGTSLLVTLNGMRLLRYRESNTKN